MCLPSLVNMLMLVDFFSLAVGLDTIALIVPEDLVEILDEVNSWSPLAMVSAPLAPEATNP